MEDRKEIIIDTNTKGIIVLAKGAGHNNNWLLLIKKVVPEDYCGNMDLMIYTHVSYCKSDGRAYVIDSPRWGTVKNMGFRFYMPTEKEIKQIKNLLAIHGYKFIKPLNKVKKL